MPKIVHFLFFALAVILLMKCNSTEPEFLDATEILEANLEAQTVKDTLPNELGRGYDFEGNGKDDSQIFQTSLSTKILDSFPLPQMTSTFKEGLQSQLKILRHAKIRDIEIDGKEINRQHISEVLNHLIGVQNDEEISLEDFTAFQLQGEDQKGNVHFTGYFTPILEVRKVADSIFKFPIYRYPVNWKGRLPSRKEIVEEEVLKGRDLEIAYAKDQFSIYTMQVQGSGIIEFENGEQKLLAFAGGNQHSYKSIGRYMIDQGYMSAKSVSLERIQKYFDENPDHVNEILNENQSYVFFSPQDSKPIGAGNVPLTPFISIAVDRKHIPLGAVLLANIPILNSENEISHHEWRFVLAQDVGAAIKGPGHVDLYMGVGKEARRQASYLHHYGQLWMILPQDLQ